MCRIPNLFAFISLALSVGACGHTPRFINMSAGERLRHGEMVVPVAMHRQIPTRPDMDEVYAVRSMPGVDLIHRGEVVGRGDLIRPAEVGVSNHVIEAAGYPNHLDVRCPNGSTTTGRIVLDDGGNKSFQFVEDGVTVMQLDRSCLLPHNVQPPPGAGM